MKKCFKCNIEKDLTEFYLHRQMADGFLGKCKECTKQDVRLRRERNIEKIRAYDRERGKSPKRIKENTARNKIRRQKHPEKLKAQTAVGNAVRDGRLAKRIRCQKCDKKTKVHGHHKDYKKPLDVVWLCPVCHKLEHKKRPEL